MALEPPSSAAFGFIAHVAQAYVSLTESAAADRETGIGGKLFYAGELDEDGRALLAAANIAGAATLVATANRAAQKQAIHQGVADFLVTSLDEALRILKNELRKRETVAVCVARQPAAVEREMEERGVAPDLLRRDVSIAPRHEALLQREAEQTEFDLKKIPTLVTWRVNSALSRDLAALDEIALTCLDADEWAARRWLRLSPRFLGRLAHGLRLLATHREFAARLAERVRERAGRGEIAFPYEICSYVPGLQQKHWFVSPEP